VAPSEWLSDPAAMLTAVEVLQEMGEAIKEAGQR